MRIDHKPDGGRGASPCLFARRTFIKFAAAIAIELPAMAMAAEAEAPLLPPSSELESMITAFAGNSGRRAEIQARIIELEGSGMPPFSLVRFTEFVERAEDYSPRLRHQMLGDPKDLEDFRNAAAFCAGVFESRNERVKQDLARAGALLTERAEARSNWCQASGFAALEAEDDLLFNRNFDLETEICRFPCKSVADVRAKLEFMRLWLDDGQDDYGLQHSHLLRSMFGLLTKGGAA